MLKYCFIAALLIINIISCTSSRVVQNEAMLFPDNVKGKWWIVNAVLQDRNGKDVHFNSLLSIDKTGGKYYSSCYVSVWAASENIYYTGIRNAEIPGGKFKKRFPLRIAFPGNDPQAMEWRLVLKRNSLNYLTDLNNKVKDLPKGYTELRARFDKQKIFAVSSISASPEAWAVKPINAEVKLSGNLHALAKSKLSIRVFSDKDILLKQSAGTYVYWLDLALQSGKQLSILFRSDTTYGTNTGSVLLWDESGNIMARPQVSVQKINNDMNGSRLSAKQYPLYFSVILPEQHIHVMLKPRMVEQEIAANKNSFWMGAVEATDEQSGQPAGKGNMYVFKQ